MLKELVVMFRRLDDEKIAWDAYRTLDYAQPEYMEQVPLVLADGGGDHADEASKYAIAANEALARAIIRHHPHILQDDAPQLLQRRSARFRAVIAEYQSENRQEDVAAILRTAMESRDDALISATLQGLRSAIAQHRLQGSSRNAVFSLLLRLCTWPSEFLPDVPSLVASLDPERAKTELVSAEMLNPENPALAAILRTACELDSDVSADSLLTIFERVDRDRPGNDRRSHLILTWVVRLAMRKQNAPFEPILATASRHSDPDVKRLGLLGRVKLRWPHDPIRASVEAVNSTSLKSLSSPVKVVAFASKYIDEVEEPEDGLLAFARKTSEKRFRYTLKSLGTLKATPHVNALTWLLDELGENPRAGLKEMRGAELKAFGKSLSALAKRLDFDRLRILLYQFILANGEAFAAN
ncbi:hypothetical protein LOC68_05410 [Blastopirellula sp. JC732]|uniref:Uncharacterized protein n=2 Tax=Blastopirellula sediminis TaxID=2894196 RepID=A0A9X1MKC6_9BACT|nr:hypothetical protein [Blastopirellula sediminis]